MSVCVPCEAEKARLKAEAYEKLKQRAIDYAKIHGLTKMVIVQTKNHPSFKRETDPDIERFPVIEILLIH